MEREYLEWIRELVSAIQQIDLHWSQGDLAGAVNSATELADQACLELNLRIDE